MSRIVFLEYTKNLIKKEQLDLREEEIANMARDLVDQARTEVNRREKERNRKAIERGIDLTRTRVVSREVYDWYIHLSPAEHVGQFGFGRKETISRSKDQTRYNGHLSHRCPSSNGCLSSNECNRKISTQIEDNQIEKQRTESQRIVLSCRNLGAGLSSSPKQNHGKENKSSKWSKSGQHNDNSNSRCRPIDFPSYPVKRKTDNNYHIAVKRQRVY